MSRPTAGEHLQRTELNDGSYLRARQIRLRIAEKPGSAGGARKSDRCTADGCRSDAARNFASSCARFGGNIASRRFFSAERYEGCAGAAGWLSDGDQRALGRI